MKICYITANNINKAVNFRHSVSTETNDCIVSATTTLFLEKFQYFVSRFWHIYPIFNIILLYS